MCKGEWSQHTFTDNWTTVAVAMASVRRAEDLARHYRTLRRRTVHSAAVQKLLVTVRDLYPELPCSF